MAFVHLESGGIQMGGYLQENTTLSNKVNIVLPREAFKLQ